MQNLTEGSIFKVLMKLALPIMASAFIGYTLTGLYTAQGDSKTPLKANFIGLVINMILDPLLILGIGPFPKLEVAGAAIATVFAQFLVMLVLIFDVYRSKSKNILKSAQFFKFPGTEHLESIFKIGTPAALQGTLYCAFSMVLTRMVSGGH